MKYSSVCLPGSVARASPPFIFRNYPPSPVLPPRASLPCRLHLFQSPATTFNLAWSPLFVIVVDVVVIVVVELLSSLDSLTIPSPCIRLSTSHPRIYSGVGSFSGTTVATGISNPRLLLFSHLPSERREKVERRQHGASLFLNDE